MKHMFDCGKIRKTDIALIIFFLTAALLAGLLFLRGQDAGDTVHITCDGREICSVALRQTKNGAAGTGTGGTQGTDAGESTQDGYYLITCSHEGAVAEYYADKPEGKLTDGTGYNLIRIADGSVSVVSADCHEQICVHHKPITGEGETIVCLPHRLVVEITGGKAGDSSDDAPSDELDGVVR